MYLEIEFEIEKLTAEFSTEVAYWFDMGELDCEAGLAPQYLDNYWYMMGYHDKEYQREIKLNYHPQRFEQF